MNGPEVRNGTTVLRNGFIDGWMDGWEQAGRQCMDTKTDPVRSLHLGEDGSRSRRGPLG